METIKAIKPTYLKKSILSSSLLPDDQKVQVEPGKRYKVLWWEEGAGETDYAGHTRIELAHGAGVWFAFNEHWQWPWNVTPEPADPLPDWDEVNWWNYNANVSKYFTVGEVTLRSAERIPTDSLVKQRVVEMARNMDTIREWWGGPLQVTSWYRPWHVNQSIGSSAPNHPRGDAVDFRPVHGSVWDLQDRFMDEWYSPGKWNGGFGLGARKGFIHLDKRHRRSWDY